jgi:hypothetical protein
MPILVSETRLEKRNERTSSCEDETRWQASFDIHAYSEQLVGCLQPRLALVDGLVLPDLFMHLAQEFNSRMFFLLKML